MKGRKDGRTQEARPRSQGAGIYYIAKRYRAKSARAATRSLIAQAGGIHLLKSIPAIIQTEPADTPRAIRAARTCGTGGGRRESIPTTPKRPTCGRHCRRYPFIDSPHEVIAGLIARIEEVQVPLAISQHVVSGHGHGTQRQTPSAP